MKDLIEKLLKEVDIDILVIMTTRSTAWKDYERYKTHSRLDDPDNYYLVWELLQDPAQTILNWQAMRDRKKQ